MAYPHDIECPRCGNQLAWVTVGHDNHGKIQEVYCYNCFWAYGDETEEPEE